METVTKSYFSACWEMFDAKCDFNWPEFTLSHSDWEVLTNLNCVNKRNFKQTHSMRKLSISRHKNKRKEEAKMKTNNDYITFAMAINYRMRFHFKQF